jgi:hypothetical protein
MRDASDAACLPQKSEISVSLYAVAGFTVI